MKIKIMNECAKCGSSPEVDASVSLHRFPQPNVVNKARCEAWAKFCFPDKEWTSTKFQSKLNRDHKMLCDKHFKSSSIANSSKILVRGSVLEKKLTQKAQQQQQSVKGAKVNTVALAESESPVQVNIQPAHHHDGVVIHVHSHQPRNLFKHKTESIQTQKHRILDNNDNKDLFLHIEAPKKLSWHSNIDDDSYNMKHPKMACDANNINSVDVYDGTNTELVSWQRQTGDDDFCNTEQPNRATQQRHINEDSCYNEPTRFTSVDHFSDDCELYGKLLTRKLSSYSLHERNLMMFKIDGLLIDYPPGFQTSTLSATTSSKKKIFNSSFSNTAKSIKKEKSNIKKQTSSEPLAQTKIIDESITSSVKFTSAAPAPVRNTVMKQPVTVTSKKSNEHVKVTTNIPNEPVLLNNTVTNQLLKLSNSMHDQTVKATGSIPNHPVSIITNKPDQVTNNIISDSIRPKHNISNCPVKVTSTILNCQSKVKSNPNQAVSFMNSTKNISNLVQNKTLIKAVKSSNILNPSFRNIPVKVLNSIPNQPIKVVNNVLHQPADVTTSDNETASSSTGTCALSPLHITIPQSDVVSLGVAKYVSSVTQSKGGPLIRLIKSKCYVSSPSQPPVLMTVPTLSIADDNTQSDVHPLDQLSSIAADHALQQHHISYATDQHVEDLNVVSHEVVLTTEDTAGPLSQHIVEAALKNSNICDEF